MVNHIYKLLLFLCLLSAPTCTSYKEIQEPEMIILMEMDEENFITVYTTRRDLEFDPPLYKGLDQLLDTMPFTTGWELEDIEE